MNSSSFDAYVPPADRGYDTYIRTVHWQDVMDRRGSRIGCEGLIRLADVPDRSTEVAISRMSSQMISRITSELLFRISLSCLLSPASSSPGGSKGAPLKIFLNVEKQTLSCAGVVDELIEASLCFKQSDYELVVEVTERPVPDRTSLRLYIDGLIRLKQAGIFVALDDYAINNEEHIELELGLAGLVKLELDVLGIPLDHASPSFLGRTNAELREQLNEFVQRYRISLLAEKVETRWQYGVVSDLPFDYFQGYYFGRPRPAEDGLMPAIDKVKQGASDKIQQGALSSVSSAASIAQLQR